MIFLLIVLLPFGTRYIFEQGLLGSDLVEPGTVSLFATQLLALLVFLAAAMKNGLAGTKAVLAKPSSLFALFFLAAAAISALASNNPAIAAVGTAATALGVGVFLAGASTAGGERTARYAFVAGGLVQSALAAAQFYSQEAWSSKWLGMAAHDAATLGASVVETDAGRWLRAYGSFSHPNMLGLYLAIGVIAAVMCGNDPILSRRVRLFFDGAAAILVSGLFFTFSRGAELALLAGMGWLIITTVSRTGSRKKALSLLRISAFVATVFLALSALLSDVSVTRLTAAGRLETRSVSERASLLDDARRIFFVHPFLGVGPGLMPFEVAANDPTRRGWDYQYVHNIPMLIATEVGLLGLFAGILLIISLIGPLEKGDEERRYPLERYFTGAALVAIFASGLFDHYLWTWWPGQVMFWAVAGLHIAAVDRAETPHTVAGRIAAAISDRLRHWVKRHFPPPIERD